MGSSYRLYLSVQMRAREEKAVESGISLKSLMENAGRAAAEEILSRWAPQHVSVLCGPGNNGGDGYVVARHLRQKGWPVRVFGQPGSDLARSMAQHIDEIEPLEKFSPPPSGLIIDALFGTGLNRPLEGIWNDVIVKVNQSGLSIIALDVPSGVNSDTGEIMGVSLKAKLTIAFDSPKPGHYLYPGKECCGHLVIKDIGIPDHLMCAPNIFQNHPDLWRNHLKAATWQDHKFTRGSVLVIGASPMVGACRMAALSARRTGAGYVTLMIPQEIAPFMQSVAWGEIIKSYQSLGHLEDEIESGRHQAIVLGPGLPPDIKTQAIVKMVLHSKLALVLDGGALSAFAGKTGELFDHLHENVVLTPHAGEFQKLFKLDQSPRIQLAQRAAALIKGTLILKGADTLIAFQNDLIIQPFASPWLSTAGTGDVLAAMVGAFLSQKMSPFDSASAAVWVQSMASEVVGPYMIAEDLITAIPQAMRSI